RGAREDPDAMIRARLLGWKHERALGQIRFARERLHDVGVETGRLHEHEELIPLQGAIGEHIEMDVAVRTGGRGAFTPDRERGHASKSHAGKLTATELGHGAPRTALYVTLPGMMKRSVLLASLVATGAMSIAVAAYQQ